jgi:hypothetical protein
MANSFYDSSQPFNCPSRCDSSKWPIEHVGNHGSQVTCHDQVPNGATLRKSIAWDSIPSTHLDCHTVSSWFHNAAIDLDS